MHIAGKASTKLTIDLRRKVPWRSTRWEMRISDIQGFGGTVLRKNRSEALPAKDESRLPDLSSNGLAIW